MPLPRLLFLCTGNSCRSQMAEGFAKTHFSEQFQVFSAGIKKHGINPLAVQVMAEKGIDISQHQSQTLDDLPVAEFEFVVTVCDNANASCPVFSGNTQTIHVAFDDPPALAKNATSHEEALGHYRRVRDEIFAYLTDFPQRTLNASTTVATK